MTHLRPCVVWCMSELYVSYRLELEWGRGRIFDMEIAQMFQRLVADAKSLKVPERPSITNKAQRLLCASWLKMSCAHSLVCRRMDALCFSWCTEEFLHILIPIEQQTCLCLQAHENCVIHGMGEYSRTEERCMFRRCKASALYTMICSGQYPACKTLQAAHATLHLPSAS